MNIYVVIEGEKATKKLYTNWIAFANKQLKPVDYLNDIKSDNFYILAGYGQPGFWQIVTNAIEDVNNHKVIDRLVISFDSENDSYEDALAKAKNRIGKNGCRVEVKIIVQHFCLETWLLGNSQIFKRNPQDQELMKYFQLFDVRINDPELLPAYPQKSWNRAQFAFKYLSTGFRDKFRGNKFYTKNNPGITVEKNYFIQVQKRYSKDKQIKSFSGFLDAFA